MTEVLPVLYPRGLATDDGALGLWAALRAVFPETAEQRRWVHKTIDVLAPWPKRGPRESRGGPGRHSRTPTRMVALDAVARLAEALANWP